VVGAGEVWAKTDDAQQTRESVKNANRERNICICSISPMMRMTTYDAYDL